MFKFESGDTAKDIITGFKGIIVGRCNYLTGCNQYLLQPKSKKMDTKIESIWFDENRITHVVAKRLIITVGKKINDNGACESAPIK